MLRIFSKYFAKTAVEKNSFNRQKQFLNWDKIEKIALILDNSAPINKNEIDKFIDQTNKYADVYFLELNLKKSTFGDWICFTKKDADFLNLPKSHVESSIKNKQYQLVINVTEKYSDFAAVITSQMHPSFSCGNNNLYGEADLVIENKNSLNIINYLKEVQKYLQMIKTK
ncbi:MAG: hypothetical protein HYX39_13530 [Bacteroidetes bacterium]|nr:hypothetical protein [Bacteroidota bacterium]